MLSLQRCFPAAREVCPRSGVDELCTDPLPWIIPAEARAPARRAGGRAERGRAPQAPHTHSSAGRRTRRARASLSTCCARRARTCRLRCSRSARPSSARRASYMARTSRTSTSARRRARSRSTATAISAWARLGRAACVLGHAVQAIYLTCVILWCLKDELILVPHNVVDARYGCGALCRASAFASMLYACRQQVTMQ